MKPTYEEIVQFLNDRVKWLEDQNRARRHDHDPSRCANKAEELRYVLNRMAAHNADIRKMVHES